MNGDNRHGHGRGGCLCVGPGLKGIDLTEAGGFQPTVEPLRQRIGRAKINLGENKDSVVIDGIINKLTIDNGDDNPKMTITINSINLINKKLKIKNFGEEDKPVTGGQALNINHSKKRRPETP